MRDFLALHWKEGPPLIVACSGGPDSKALLYLLLECRKFFNLNLHVVHVDHGWREESAREAQQLQMEVHALGLNFHLQTLKDLPAKEDIARGARYDFFKKVLEHTGAQAVVLGHQREDQAETVLKRVLEGASLTACGGMKTVSIFRGMTLLRPLLAQSKSDLIRWLHQKKISYIQDATNLSPQYLRGRLRSSILPALERSFGKSIIKNLCRLGERVQKMESHLNREIAPLWEKVEEESKISISLLQELDDATLEYFLKRWIEQQGIRLSIDQLAILVRMVRSSKGSLETATHRLETKHRKLALKELFYYSNR